MGGDTIGTTPFQLAPKQMVQLPNLPQGGDMHLKDRLKQLEAEARGLKQQINAGNRQLVSRYTPGADRPTGTWSSILQDLSTRLRTTQKQIEQIREARTVGRSNGDRAGEPN